MTFVNYKTQNNVFSYLSMALSSEATTLQVNDWGIFPNEFPFICTLEHYDDVWNCIKREIVKCTARNEDSLTIVRAFEKCVSDDTLNPKILQQAPFNFVAWDSISLTLTSEIVQDIQNEITRQLNNLETAQSCINSDEQRISDIEDFINNL